MGQEIDKEADRERIPGLPPALPLDIMISLYEVPMAQFVVRDLEDDVKARLKRRAERHRRSMEDEVRHILRNAAKEENRAEPKLGSRIAALRQMIILDTNVLSALMRKVPEGPVVAWLDGQPAESVWITSITLFEARLGLALLPKGRRRQSLETSFGRLLEEDLDNRVLDFDSAAATEAALLAAERQKAGRPVDMRDTQTAGIALARHATLATRNIRHFRDLKVPVVDPWTARAGSGVRH